MFVIAECVDRHPDNEYSSENTSCGISGLPKKHVGLQKWQQVNEFMKRVLFNLLVSSKA